MIKQCLNDILTSVCRGEMEIIRKKKFVVLTEIILSLLARVACFYSGSFLATRWTPIHTSLMMSIFVFNHISLSVLLPHFPLFLSSFLTSSLSFSPSPPLPVFPHPSCCFNWPRKTSSTQNRVGVGLGCPSVSFVPWSLGMKHGQEIWNIWKATGLVGKAPDKALKMPGLES